jgi:formylglycine-generating enzyme required for sulfatase activity
VTGKIFINYRRGDSIATAGRLHDRLAQAFGRGNLFMDVDHIPPGVDFVDHLKEQLAACDVLLAVIGPGWVGAKGADGRRRLDSPEDFVAIEIAAALAKDIRVIPVLIDGASMPGPEDLPDSLKALARRNAVEVRHTQFGRDVDALIEKLRDALKSKATPRSFWLLPAAALVLIAIGVTFYRFFPPDSMFGARPAAVSNAVGPEQATPAQAAATKPSVTDTRPDPARDVVPGSGQAFRDSLADGTPCPFCPEMVVVPRGSFSMGSPASEFGRRDNEGPAHPLSIAQALAIGKFPVTRREFAAFANGSAYHVGDGCEVMTGVDWKLSPDRSWKSPGFAQDDRHPVVCVSFTDGRAFAAWLSEKTGRPYRLLTEAEWEYAARAGTTTRYYFGDDENDFCRYGNGADSTLQKSSPGYGPVLSCDDGYAYTAPVGSFMANAFGLYDMHGNTWQWVEDCYHPNYAGAPTDGSAWKGGNCPLRVVRGGSWASFPRTLRVASRFGNQEDRRRDQWGIRVARSLSP